MIKTISLPCSGKVDIPYLLKAFETGADGVAIVTCKKNECRHFEGNLRAHKRAEASKGCWRKSAWPRAGWQFLSVGNRMPERSSGKSSSSLDG